MPNYSEGLIVEVLNAIPWEKENQIIADVIHGLAKTPSEWRTQIHTRAIIRILRLRGHPICSNGKGYWQSWKPADLKMMFLSQRRRAKSVMEVADIFEKHYCRETGEKPETPPEVPELT